MTVALEFSNAHYAVFVYYMQSTKKKDFPFVQTNFQDQFYGYFLNVNKQALYYPNLNKEANKAKMYIKWWSFNFWSELFLNFIAVPLAVRILPGKICCKRLFLSK